MSERCIQYGRSFLTLQGGATYIVTVGLACLAYMHTLHDIFDPLTKPLEGQKCHEALRGARPLYHSIRLSRTVIQGGMGAGSAEARVIAATRTNAPLHWPLQTLYLWWNMQQQGKNLTVRSLSTPCAVLVGKIEDEKSVVHS